MPLHEDYRPRHFAAVVGQDAAIAQIKSVMARPSTTGRAWYIAVVEIDQEQDQDAAIYQIDDEPAYASEETTEEPEFIF